MNQKVNQPSAFNWPAYMSADEGAQGWEAHNDEAAQIANAEALYAAQLSAFEEAKLVHDVFTTGRGPELLEHLRSMTIEQPSFVMSGQVVPVDNGQGTIATLAPEQQGLIREGQNSIYRWISQQIEQARGGPPPEPQLAAATPPPPPPPQEN